jgi:hypothetical protein
MSAPWRSPADSQSSWLGTRGYGVRPAPPGGLTLVQDFLNTRVEGAALYTAAFGPEEPATDFYAAPALSVIGNVLGFFEDEIEFVT